MEKLPGALSKLTEPQYDELIKWLSMGLSDSKLVKKIQDDNGWLLDVKPATLVKTVNRWRRSSAQNAITISVAQKLTNSRGGLKPSLDIMADMETLIVAQKERIAKLADKEGNMNGFLLESMSNEMKSLFVMLEKLGKFQLETGILRRVKVGQLGSDYDPETQEETHGPWTPELEARYRLIEGDYEHVEDRA
jgi:hypothetical protein